MQATQTIKIEHIPGKAVTVYTRQGLNALILSGVIDTLSDDLVDALPMTKRARAFWNTWKKVKHGVTKWEVNPA